MYKNWSLHTLSHNFHFLVGLTLLIKYNTVFLFTYLFLIWRWEQLVVISREVELDLSQQDGKYFKPSFCIVFTVYHCCRSLYLTNLDTATDNSDTP